MKQFSQGETVSKQLAKCSGKLPGRASFLAERGSKALVGLAMLAFVWRD